MNFGGVVTLRLYEPNDKANLAFDSNTVSKRRVRGHIRKLRSMQRSMLEEKTLVYNSAQARAYLL